MPIQLVLFGPRTRITVSLLHLFSFLSLVLLQTSSEAAQTDSNYVYHDCPQENNNASGELFMYNVGSIFNGKLYNEGGRSLYHNATEGVYPDKVYGLYNCRFDVSNEVCQDCIKVAIDTIVKNCTGAKEAIIWYDQCLSFKDLIQNVTSSDSKYAAAAQKVKFQTAAPESKVVEFFSQVVT